MRAAVVFASIAGAMIGSAAHAGPLPDAYAYTDIGVGGKVGIGQTVTATDVSGSSGANLSVQVAAQNSPGLKPPYGGGGYLDLFYYYRVKAPAGVASGVPTPVTLTGSINASSTGATGEAIAYINYDANGEAANLGPGITLGFPSAPAGPGVIYAGEYFGGATGGPQTRSVTYDVYTNTVEEIALYAFAVAGSPSDHGSSAGFASVDPVIVLSPTLQQAGYSLEFSSNVTGAGGPTGVPEPATWMMMLVGLGALGAATRGRRSRCNLSGPATP